MINFPRALKHLLIYKINIFTILSTSIDADTSIETLAFINYAHIHNQRITAYYNCKTCLSSLVFTTRSILRILYVVIGDNLSPPIFWHCYVYSKNYVYIYLFQNVTESVSKSVLKRKKKTSKAYIHYFRLIILSVTETSQKVQDGSYRCRIRYYVIIEMSQTSFIPLKE